MSLELLNTSAPRGVRPGATGFCTVGMTAGVSPVLEERLTLLSGYRWLVPPGEKGAENNPVAYSHWRLMAGGRTLSILSRVCDAGFDYSRRSNRFAHHVVIDPAEQSEPGPAWVMMQPGVMRTKWAGEPMVFPEGPDIPAGVSAPHVCRAWAGACGDAGWAGVLAEAFAADPSRVSCIVYPPGLNMLALIDEAIALLPAALRWQVTFCTYFTDLPAGMTCAWRCFAAGSRASADAQRQASSDVFIDLTKPLTTAPDSPCVFAARYGTAIAIESNEPAPVNATGQVEPAKLAPLLPPLDTIEPATGEGDSSATSEGKDPGDSASIDIASALPASVSSGPVISEPVASSQAAIAAQPRRSWALFWAFAAAWPLIVAGGVVGYMRWRPSRPATGPLIVLKSDIPHAIARTASTQSVAEHDSDHGRYAEVAQKLEAAGRQLEDRDQTIAQLRQVLTEVKDDLASAKIRAETGKSSQAELEKLKADYADVQAKLAAAAATTPVAMDRTVELFRDEVELWPGDGHGPPDVLQLDSYKPPEGLIVERGARQVVLKSSGAGTGAARAIPVELAIIKVDGGRVVLSWITVNRGQVSAAVRAWLQLSRLAIQRGQKVVSVVRFVPLRSAEINVDHETPLSLLPDVHWRDSLQHVALTPPATLPPGWSARQKDDQTIVLASTTAPDAAFDVQISVRGNEVQAQTTYAVVQLRLVQTSEEKAAIIAVKKSAAIVAAQKIKDLADETGTKAKDPARQTELDVALQNAAAAAATQRDADAMRALVEAALTQLRNLPLLSIPVVNHDNGLVLSVLHIKRGQ